MNADTVVPWLLQPARIWIALAGGFVPGLIAAFKRRARIRWYLCWYLYGFICTLIAWPLLALPTILVLLVRRPAISTPSPHHNRGADGRRVLMASGVGCCPCW